MKKIAWILLAVLLIGLIGGASVLYNRLSSEYSMEQLATEPESVEQEATQPQHSVEETAPQEEYLEATETPVEEADAADAQEHSDATETTEAAPVYYAPDFTVVDGEGNEVHLSDFFGKPIVLNFWASWCDPCKSEMPGFNEVYLERGEEVQFVMVNMTDGARETVDTAKAFLEETGYSFPVFFDVEHDADMTYGIYSMPTTIFINADGALVTYAMGAISADTLQRGISMITE